MVEVVLNNIFELSAYLSPIFILAAFAVTTPFINYILKQMGKEKYLGVWTSFAFLSSLIVLTISLIGIRWLGEPIILRLGFSPIESTLIIDPLGQFFAFIFLIVSLAAAIHSITYMERDLNLGSYYLLMQFMTIGLVGLTYTNDLFTFFVLWELMAISSYVLVAFRYHLDEPVEAGVKYILMSGVGSLIMLYGISYVYGFVGSLNAKAIHFGLTALPFIPLIFVLSLLLIGFGIKAAFFPFWTWLPDAHPAAPSPISALLSGIVIKAGILGIIKFIVPVVGFIRLELGLTMAVIAGLTMTVANLLALMQDDIKRLLAYSSITNIGFILIGVAAAIYGAGISGVASSLFHTFSHALGKGLAFLAVGSIIYRLETRSISKIEGLGRKMPFTAAALIIALLGLAGMPPLPGFWSKWLLIYSSIQAGLWGLAFIGVFNSVLAVIFYLWLLQRLFFAEPTEKVLDEGKEPPFPIKLALALLMVIMIIIGFYPAPIFDMVINAAEVFMMLFG
jgi:proton-translocating NADH-quinone oxidoreductase chain N